MDSRSAAGIIPIVAASRIVPVAQLDRASASGAEGYRFDSCRGYWPTLLFQIGAARCRLISLSANSPNVVGVYGDPLFPDLLASIAIDGAIRCNPLPP